MAHCLSNIDVRKRVIGKRARVQTHPGRCPAGLDLIAHPAKAEQRERLGRCSKFTDFSGLPREQTYFKHFNYIAHI